MNWPSRFLAASFIGFTAVQAQIFHFKDVKVPEAKSLTMEYVYFIFDEAEAKDKSQGPAQVNFHNLKIRSTSEDKSDADMERYKGIQVSLMRYDEFWNQIDPGRMCATPQDVAEGLAKLEDHLIIKKPKGTTYAAAHVYRHQLAFGKKEPDEKLKVTKSGAYVLVLSNCGSFDGAVVDGEVIVRNPHGYLPANEFDKINFYIILGIFYAVLFVFCGLLCLRWLKELLKFHYCILAVTGVGVLECVAWVVFLMGWNSGGDRSQVTFAIAAFASVARATTSYMMVLLACLGWGVTRPVLDDGLTCRISFLAIVYMILNFVRELVISYRHSHSLPMSFVLLCLLPVSAMNGGIFYWVFSALSNLRETLEAQAQTEKLSIFNKLWYILLIATVFALAVLGVQIFVISLDASHTWRQQWMVTDGAPEVAFGVILISIMVLWAPNEDSQRLAYAQQIDGDEGGVLGENAAPDTVGDIWGDEGQPDKDDDSFWASTKEKPGDKAPADVIGAGGV